jgi:uncharacterized DUF497 family protein
MEFKVSAFDWDDGNRDKCRKHGLSMSDVEHVLVSARNLIVRDVQNSLTEDRYIAIGKIRAGRFSFVVFTLRAADDQFKLRPISARYMHKKEIAKYEKEIAGLQNG